MNYTKYWEVRDQLKTRFSSVNKTEAEFFLKKLLNKLREAQKKPYIVEVAR